MLLCSRTKDDIHFIIDSQQAWKLRVDRDSVFVGCETHFCWGRKDHVAQCHTDSVQSFSKIPKAGDRGGMGEGRITRNSF